MRADEILLAVEGQLRREHRRRRTVYRREWSIGLSTTRVDVAAINGRITGCEIKSGRDNFDRLAGQVRMYSSVLDSAILVVEGEAAAARALGQVPEWWSVWVATPAANGVALAARRTGRLNPAPDPFTIAQLLWRDDAYAVLLRRGLNSGLRAATRWRLWERLAEELPLQALQREVHEAIKARPER